MRTIGLRVLLLFANVGLSALFSSELTIATLFHNEAFYLQEWIEYHRMVGVDHFLLYNDRSTDHWKEVLSPYIEEGLVEVFDWPIPSTGSHDSIKSGYGGTQSAAFWDAIIRTTGNTKWLASIDLDEFILPMKDATIVECLDKHFSKASAIYVNWRCFGTGGVYLSPTEPILCRLTACSFKNHSRNAAGKPIVRPECVRTDLPLIDFPYPLTVATLSPHFFLIKPEATYFNGDGKPLVGYDGINLQTDGISNANLIRINHYVLKDENYYQNVRLARAQNGYDGYRMAEVDLLLELHKSFSLLPDYAMVNFIKKYHREAYLEFCRKVGSDLEF